MPSDADQIRDLEEELDALDNPTTAEVLFHTRDYDAGIVAAIGVQRGTAGGEGGGSQPALQLLTQTFTAAQIKALTDASPLEILPAVANTFYALYSWATVFQAGGVQYTDGADLVLSTGDVANGWYEFIARAANLQGAIDYSDFVGNGSTMTWLQQYGSATDPAELFGQNLSLALDPGGSPNTPYAAGTGTLTLFLLYGELVLP